MIFENLDLPYVNYFFITFIPLFDCVCVCVYMSFQFYFIHYFSSLMDNVYFSLTFTEKLHYIPYPISLSVGNIFQSQSKFYYCVNVWCFILSL